MQELRRDVLIDVSWSHVVDNGAPCPGRVGVFSVTKAYISNRGFRAVFLYRLAHLAHHSGHSLVAKLISRHAHRSCGSSISPSAEIGPGLRLPHPDGLVIGSGVRIGRMVSVSQHVTLGGNFWKRDSLGREMPVIGDGCWILAGAIVAGPVSVGKDSVIGPNCVITRDVPPDSCCQLARGAVEVRSIPASSRLRRRI